MRLGIKRQGVAAIAALGLVSTGATARADATVEVTDASFDTAASMFAYTEFELSGEPLAESLGLDLDVLDPNAVDLPTAFDYAAGIESYEYSEEAMYALDYQSRLGPHLVNGPVNASRGGTLKTLGERVVALTQAVRFPADELPLNLYPISIPYLEGVPEFAGPVDVRGVGRDTVELRDAEGRERQLDVIVPAYFRDFASLAWKGAETPTLSPAAIGGALLKETLWSQDFLGGMHTVDGDEEIEAESANMDADGTFALGVSAVDGMNGVLLTEIAWDKLATLQGRLAFDGKKLGTAFGPDYDAKQSPVWFPHRVRVTQSEQNGVHAIGSLEVVDRGSELRDQWLLLWSVSEFYAFCDGRTARPDPNPAFLAVFDGSPFPSAPEKNRDADAANDAVGSDPFSLASNVANLVFENLLALHVDPETGVLVDRWDGTRDKTVTAFDAAYAIVALSVYQRARDALPVGYASGSADSNGLETADGKRALEQIRKQAKFITEQLVGPAGLVADRYVLGKGREAGTSLDAQFAAIRGLAAAFVATGDARFKTAARAIYAAVEREQFDAALATFAETPGRPTEHTPWTAGAISAGLRVLLLNLRNDEGEDVAQLRPSHLTERYTTWFRSVINGGRSGGGMQLAEWLGDSGENVIASSRPDGPATVDASPATDRPAEESVSSDSDRDGVPQVTAAGGEHGMAMTLAGRVRVGQRDASASAGD